MSNAVDFMGQAMNAAAAMMQKHAAERAAKKHANGENAGVSSAASK
jgi:hypothetical protein